MRRQLSSFLTLTTLSLSLVSLLPQTSYSEEKSILDFSPKELESVYNEWRKREKITNFLNSGIATFPLVLPVKDGQSINLNPSFITKIVFPPQVKVLKAFTSFSPNFFSSTENVVLIQPKKDFIEGNLVVFYYDEEKKRQGTVSLYLKQVEPTKGLYFQTVVFTYDKVLSPSEVLREYRRLYGYYPSKGVYFKVKGVFYLIEPNSKFANLRVGSVNYLVIPTLVEF